MQSHKKAFVMKQFTVQQRGDVFAVGTDGLLLGALCPYTYVETVLEVGTGTGLVSLMLAQRMHNSTFTAIDIDENAATLAYENFRNSPFSERMQCYRIDFNQFVSENPFDLLVCNPPYFAENNSGKLRCARQQISLTYEDLIRKANYVLHTTKGNFCVIIPRLDKEIFIKLCQQNKLFLENEIVILPRLGMLSVRVILAFGREEISPSTEEFIIEEAPRRYSEQYLNATKTFHCFSKKG